MDQSYFRACVENFEELPDSFPHILQRSFVSKKGLISTIQLDPEVLHAVLLTCLLDILGLFSGSLNCHYHRHLPQIFQLSYCADCRTMPEHDLGHTYI